MLKEALLVRHLKNQAVQCRVCEHFCTLKPGEWGTCGVRLNREGTLYSVVYGVAVAAHVDPIEKKPLFHFLPGAKALSIGTYGCNLRCRWCQNWEMSQVRQVDWRREWMGEPLSPEQLVALAVREGIEVIAYTYNEPTVFFEYTYDTARLAHERGIKNVYVSNGFMSTETLEMLAPYLDGINVDLKGFTESLYREYTGSRLAPIKRNIAWLAHDPTTWIEVTTLVIPQLNDSDEELRAAAEWLASVDPEMPWHVTAFYPHFQMRDRPPTPPATLARAYEIGKEAGLKYIYVGNVYDPARENTVCPQCGTVLVQRQGYRVRPLWETPGVCPRCGTHIPGVWRSA